MTASSSASDITTFAGQWATGRAPVRGLRRERGHHVGVRQLRRSARPVDPGGLSTRPSDSQRGRSRWPSPTIRDRPAGHAGHGDHRGGPGHRRGAGHREAPAAAGAGRRLRLAPHHGHRPGLAVAAPLFGTQVGIAEHHVPGVSAGRTIVAPAVAGGDPSAVVLAKAQPYQSGCMLTSRAGCARPSSSSATEEQYGFDQAFNEAAPRAGGAARLGDPHRTRRWPTTYALAGRDQPVVTASSTVHRRPAGPAEERLRRRPGDRPGSPARPTRTRRLTIRWGHAAHGQPGHHRAPAGRVGPDAGADHRIAAASAAAP